MFYAIIIDLCILIFNENELTTYTRIWDHE